MAGDTTFSAGRRWGIFFSVVVSMLAVGALVFMVNYLSVLYPVRFYWNARFDMGLSQQSLGLVNSITNDVKITLYYDREDPIYSYIVALLDEYRLANPRVSFRTVDYLRDAAGAQQLLATYKQYLAAGDTNLVIFECNGRTRVMPGKFFGNYAFEQVPDEKEVKWRQPLKAFEGERVVSAILLGITSEKPFKTYYMRGHNEHRLESTDPFGYAKVAGILSVNNIVTTNLPNLLDTNEIPVDCNLLIIAGPVSPFSTNELKKINNYLNQGGRLFVLLNTALTSTGQISDTGLELLLAEWGVDVGRTLVRDPDNTTKEGIDLIVTRFNPKHPLVNSMLTSRLQMIQPRSIGKLPGFREAPTAPQVTELAWTGDTAYIGTKPAGHSVPLMVAVEKAPAPGTISERGATRIVVAGDSFFLDCQVIDNDNHNKDFAQNAVNWLLDQKQVMAGVGPHPVREYTVVMTRAQMRTIKWLFLVIMPGSVLLIGLLVWLRRRR